VYNEMLLGDGEEGADDFVGRMMFAHEPAEIFYFKRVKCYFTGNSCDFM
jgi:hypothetical protein